VLTNTERTGTSRDFITYPGDPRFDEARGTFNLLIDQRPAAIALPHDEHEVAAAVRFARREGLQLTAQATGHNAGPLGALARTLLVNTSGLTGVEIDASARMVRVGAATKWEKVIEPLSELGLAALHGSSPDVGIVGYSLGGGLGWLARKYGMQCNSVTAIDVVTADGLLVRCDHEHEPDLFWALRGGGGNFGVVTAIEFRVYPVESVYAGSMFFPSARAGEVARAWRDLLPSLPDELTSQFSVTHVPDMPFAPEPMRGQSVAVLSAALIGDERRGRGLLEPVRSLGPMMDTFGVAAPIVLAALSMDPPNPLPYASTHALLDCVPDATVDELLQAADRASGIVSLQLRHLGGAVGRAPAGAGVRRTLRGSLARVDEACAAHHAGQYASFVEQPADARAFYDAGTWAALRGIKGLYDPADLIRGNHHIPPSL
jgi:FAD/FMN-containing dehydrogenase